LFYAESIISEENSIFPIYPWKKELYEHYFNKEFIETRSYKTIDYKKKYYKLLNTILKNERLRYRDLLRKRWK
jgi:hypothetical protein